MCSISFVPWNPGDDTTYGHVPGVARKSVDQFAARVRAARIRGVNMFSARNNAAHVDRLRVHPAFGDAQQPNAIREGLFGSQLVASTRHRADFLHSNFS